MIYIDADAHLTTWRRIADIGGWRHYNGRAGRGDTIVRWGANHGRFQGHYPNGVRILNPRLVIGKVEQNRLFTNAGVAVPTVYNTRAQWERAGNPRLVVKPDVGQMGTGMRLTNRPGFKRDQLYQEYIEKDREFRAMMVHRIMAFFMEKFAPANGDFRWNEHRGARWGGVGEERGLRRNVKNIGEAALRALEYDFGAVDIIMQGRNLYVLEVNSRPEFGDINARRFVNAIHNFLERREE